MSAPAIDREREAATRARAAARMYRTFSSIYLAMWRRATARADHAERALADVHMRIEAGDAFGLRRDVRVILRAWADRR